jgi:hypothetical protein
MKNRFQRKDAEAQRRKGIAGARALARFRVRFHDGLKLPDGILFTVKRPEGRAPSTFASPPLCDFALNS